MCHEHTAAAVAFETQLVHSVTIRDIVIEETHVSLPEICNDLGTESVRASVTCCVGAHLAT